jgi:plasmid stability protein
MTMGNLSVRRPDNDTLERLRVRAAEHGVSMEEVRRSHPAIGMILQGTLFVGKRAGL